MLDAQHSGGKHKKLIGLGAYGPYGLYEAIDFTKRRLAQESRIWLSKLYGTPYRHELVSNGQCILQNLLQHRFLKEPFIRAGAYLLGEKIPISPPVSRATKI